MLTEKGSLSLIGAHDGLSAILGQRAGFDAIWASGFEISASYGVPDANILTMSEVRERCRIMVSAVDIPVIADCDNGFGNAINTIETVRQLESAGVGGVCIEDNVFPKRCSFYAGVSRDLVPTNEHVLKIRACIEHRRTKSFFIIARTEALILGRGIDEAITRAEAYAGAGADAILVHSKAKVPDEVLGFAKCWKRSVPLVAVPTTYDTIPESELNRLGFRVVIYANHGLRAATKAMRDTLTQLKLAGHASAIRNCMVTLDDVFDLVHLRELQNQERRYLDGELANAA